MNTQKNNENDLALKLFVVLNKAAREIADRVESDMRSHGLNPTEFQVLELLYHKGDQPIQQIGKRVLLASGSITYVVDRLEQKGYLERRSCPKDRRVTYAAITTNGKTLMDDIFPRHREALEEMFSVLDNDEKATMIDKLKKLGLFVKDIDA
ncbi:MarR family winged helix-turn-helix transcriptional regulator [Caldalkalibacillus salinus]|uniref:MarR family winged helix-turn-helix transcriptional regulator n=1 Tax=Caldalkalibacillus salinus TaxID=2803787 RepID=UPI001921EE29|nr:MarR family transcriptional regulator [Caldalkalibacillus salinus]